MSNNIIEVSEEKFNDEVINQSSNKLVVVDFWAPWCEPCKQLTPVLEKIVNNSDKVILAKINIDENQQVASQLKIQSIPTVIAFKDKQIVNGFQGVIPENKIIEFIEKALGEKLSEDFSEFYRNIDELLSNKKYDEANDNLLDFISKNSEEVKAISLYLENLLNLNQYDEINQFIQSLDEQIVQDLEIQKIIKKLEIINKSSSGPTIEEMFDQLAKDKKNIDLVIKISEKFFSSKKYDEAFNLLIEKYSLERNKIKTKMIEFFDALGNSNEYTIKYRKILSSIIFS
ncbi:MAG: thioredoxin [Pelagibacteraceae bacterium]|nr:thioredoxin [Pelagibacteraceae bacterium]|tara:strand:- start:66158 stop:67015 length:858 start_codon:yes stop_codon:yes gene_type:complete